MSSLLEKTIKNIIPLSETAMEQCQRRWDSIGKPLRSLGKLEDALVQAAGIQRTAQVDLFVLDAGMASDTPRTERRKVRYGTADFTKEPASYLRYVSGGGKRCYSTVSAAGSGGGGVQGDGDLRRDFGGGL